ncbi:MAG: spore coat protein [Clostridiales bacterium]
MMNTNDKSILWDCLKDQKFLASNYTQMATEVACGNLLQDTMKIAQEEVRINYDIFNMMNERGWYPVAAANMQEVNKVKTKAESLASTIK